MKTKTNLQKIKWFWAWQDDKREQWLTQMSLAGWHLDSISRLGLAFNFVEGKPCEYSYQLDFRPEKGGKIEEYLAFIEDSGWEHIESYADWHYFRKPNDTGESKEFFSDFESKLEKYKRLQTKLQFSYPLFLIIFLANLDKYPLWFAIILVTVFVVMIIFVSISIFGVANRIKQLEQLVKY